MGCLHPGGQAQQGSGPTHRVRERERENEAVRRLAFMVRLGVRFEGKVGLRVEGRVRVIGLGIVQG